MPIHSVFLKYFDEVCKSGSIRKAAKNLYVSSSAVNRQILKKEEELGVKLFERSHNGIELTAAGEILAQHISRTLADSERTMRELEACKDFRPQGITIVGQESVISRFLPPTLIALHNKYPGVATSFVAASGRKLNDLLISGRADIALAFDPAPNPDIKLVATIELPVGAVMSSTHALAKRNRVRLKECTEYPLILPDESWPLRDILDKELNKIEIDPGIIVTTSNSMEFLRTMLGKKFIIGFQTIIGLEEALRDGSLIHYPCK